MIGIMLLLPLLSFSQSALRIGDFDKIVVSPHINVVLIKGDESSIKIESANIDDRKINVDTDNDVLSIYLEGARYHNKYEKYEKYDKNYKGKWKEDIYKDSEVTAYVTYKYLKSIQVRGEQYVKSDYPIDQNSFKMVLYGEVNVRLKEIRVNDLKLSTYGENEIFIESGRVNKQVIKCYGENEIYLNDIDTNDIRSSLYGENRLELRADGEIKITAFGESDIRFSGNAYVNKGIIIGDTDIRRTSK